MYGKTMQAVALGAILVVTLSSAQADGERTNSGWAIHYDTSQPLRDLVDARDRARPTGLSMEVPIRTRPGTENRTAPEGVEPDARVQSHYDRFGGSFTPTLMQSFPGLSNDDNAATIGGRIVPPDVNGDVGLDENGNVVYLQYINLIWALYDDSGTLISGPSAGNTFWDGFGGFCESNNDGDPVVLYDDNAGRWMVSQFSINQGIQCVAVSQSSDPLGSYHRYAFEVTPGGNNDYPKMGVWDDGTTGSAGQSAYTFTLRDFGGAGGSFSVSAGVMERDKMLLGQAAQFKKFSNTCAFGDCIEGQLPPHLDGAAAPNGTCPTFWTMVDGAYDDTPGGDGYRNHALCVDWSNIGSSTYVEGPQVNAANFDRFLGNGFSDCISPVLDGEVLDCLAAFTMYRAQYRWFGDHASVVMNTTVDVGGDRAGIRWGELRSTDGDSAWGLHQEGTWAPEDGNERWMGSIAMDQDGNIALGYTVAGTNLRPAVRYAARAAGDPLGTLGTEVSCIEGTGSQTSSFNRWGDYSSMSVDPVDDCTFWYTQEYQEVTGSFDFNTRICSFKFADCGDPCVPTGAEVCGDGEDNDCDGQVDCLDSDCDSAPVCAPVCPDGICEYPDEVGQGEFACEDCFTAGTPECGNGTCEANLGEDCVTCAADCAGRTRGRPSSRFCCGGVEAGACDRDECNQGGFVCDTGSAGGTVVCGDMICDPLFEDASQCAYDCLGCDASETNCTDDLDNDCDGLVDELDSDCVIGCPDVGNSCTFDGQCCSNKCRGPRGRKTCKA